MVVMYGFVGFSMLYGYLWMLMESVASISMSFYEF